MNVRQDREFLEVEPVHLLNTWDGYRRWARDDCTFHGAV
jgi:hypothetical protein